MSKVKTPSMIVNEAKARKAYDQFLNQIVIPIVGNKSTYLDELNMAGAKLIGRGFKGVYPADRIPILDSFHSYCILNLDRSYEPGSHWIACAYEKTPYGSNIYVYDSFGRSHTQIIPSLDKKYDRKTRNHMMADVERNRLKIINVDMDAEQKVKESNCGARCLAWLLVFKHMGSGFAKLI